MATLTDRIAVLIDSRANVAGFNQAASASGQLQTQQQGLFSRLAQNKTALLGWGAAGLAASALVVKGATSAAESYADLAGDVRNVKNAIGESAETASRWVAVADDFGISGDKLGTSLGRFGRNLQSGALDLSQWGAEIVRSRDGAVDMQETLLSVADAYKNESSAAARSELLLRAFGRSGRELIPILEGGRDRIKEMFAAVPEGQIFDDEDLSKAREYQLAMDNLSDAAREFEVAIGEFVAPAMGDLANNAAEAARAVGPIIAELREIPLIFSTDIKDDIADLFGVGGEKRISDSFSKGTVAAEEQAAAIRDTIAAIREYNAGALDTEGSNLRLEGAMRNYTLAVQEHGVASFEARTAFHDSKAALDGVVQSMVTAGTKEKDQITTLQFLKTIYPELGGVIDGYIGTLQNIPGYVHTNVTADTSQAQSEIQALINKFGSLSAAAIAAGATIGPAGIVVGAAVGSVAVETP